MSSLKSQHVSIFIILSEILVRGAEALRLSPKVLTRDFKRRTHELGSQGTGGGQPLPAEPMAFLSLEPDPADPTLFCL